MFKRLVLFLFTFSALSGLTQQAGVSTEPKPECNAVEPCWIGDGWCDTDLNTEACGYDGGDCCKGSCEASALDRQFPCGTCGYACIDPTYSERYDSPSSLPSMSPTTPPTREPPSASSESLFPTSEPSEPQLPSSRPTTSPTRHETQPPSTTTTEQPTPVSTDRPLSQPSRAPSHAPTQLPTPLPTPMTTANATPMPTPPNTLSALQPTSQPTSPPTSSASTAVPTQLRQEHFEFIAANTSANASLPRLSENETTAIATSLVMVLRNVSDGVRVEVRSANLAALPLTPGRLRRLSPERSPASRWNVSSVITHMHSDDEAVAIQAALNASLWDGSLEATLRTVSAASPGAQTLQYAVLCPEASAETCGIPAEPAPAAGADAQGCARSSRRWDVLYASPLGFPWYLLWLGVQATLWSFLLLSAVCQLTCGSVPSEAAYVLMAMQFIAGIHLAYLAIILWDYAVRQGRLACTEFEFVDLSGDNGGRDLGRVTLVLLLLRTLTYPATLAVTAGAVSILARWPGQQWRIVLPFMFVAIAASFFLVLYAVTASTAGHSAAGLPRVAMLIQTVCGTLAFLLPLPLCCAGCTVRARSPQPDDEEAGTTFDYALQPVETYQAAAEARRRDRATAEEEEAVTLTASRWSCRLYCATTAYAGVAILTAVPEVLSAPTSAFLLYSVASRVLELYIGWLCVHVAISRLQWAAGGEAPSDGKLGQAGPLGGGGAGATGCVQRPAQGNSNGANRDNEAPGDVSGGGARDGAVTVNFWRKPWAWVFAPEAETPLGRLVWNSSANSTQETREREAPVEEGRPVNVGYVRARLDSHESDGTDSSDSTDSGKEYFI